MEVVKSLYRMAKDASRYHVKFNASDSDVTIESANGVLFGLHTQNLKINTGAFPGSEFSTRGEYTKLAENSDVLEIVFAYIYPQRHPNLENMEFALLAQVAEAVEKYEVFPAINLCKIRMKEFLPQHAADILVHGIKHGYPELINEAALGLCRQTSMSKFIHKFSPPAVMAWIRYSESWKAVFEAAYQQVAAFPASTFDFCHTLPAGTAYTTHGQNIQICALCQGSIVRWVMQMENQVSLELLKHGLKPSTRRTVCGLGQCSTKPGQQLEYINSPGCAQYRECKYTSLVVQTIEDGIAKIPPFEQFLL